MYYTKSSLCGIATEHLTPIAPPVWAYFRQLSGKEVYAAMAVQATAEVQFVINWRDDVTTAHIVRYKGILYDITRVDVFEGYKAAISLYCKLSGEKFNAHPDALQVWIGCNSLSFS